MKFALLLFIPTLLLADSGKVILRQQAGPETITVFADPVPLRAGQPADCSVLIQDTATLSPILEGTVQIELSDGSNAQATHAQASNKLLFASRLKLARSGSWTLTVRHGKNEVSGQIVALEESPEPWRYWPYFAVVPLALGLFALNRHLRRIRATRIEPQ